MTDVEILLNDIWTSLDSGPTQSSVMPFYDRIRKVNMTEFIIRNFSDANYPMPDRLLLSTFDLWKHFSKHDWFYIFNAIGNSYGQYYMSIFATTYLGINPGFTANYAEPTYSVQGSDIKPQNVNFIGNLEGELKDSFSEELFEDFGITINEFIAVNKRLVNNLKEK